MVEDDVSLFKRIRFVSEKERLNQNMNGPFIFQYTADQPAIDPTERQRMEEQNARQEYERLKADFGEFDGRTLNGLHNLTRLLRNHGSYSEAEEFL